MSRKYLKSSLQAEMRRWYKDTFGAHLYTQVYAEINGTPMYLNENEVRYLQIKCVYAVNDGRFKDFCNSHIIYNGHTKRNHEPMIWCKNGKFKGSFCNGFYDANDKMSVELFDITE